MKNIQDILTKVRGYFDLTSFGVGDVVTFDDSSTSYYFLGIVTGFEQQNSGGSEASIVKILSLKENEYGQRDSIYEELKFSPVAAWRHNMKVIGTEEELESKLKQLYEENIDHSEEKEHSTPWTPSSEDICDRDEKSGEYSISTVIDRDISSFKEALLRTLNSNENSRSLVNMSMISREIPYVVILIFKEN